MSTFYHEQGSVEESLSPKVMDVMKLHFIQDIQSGIFDSYHQTANEQLQGVFPDIELSRILCHAEAPLAPLVYKDWYADVENADCLLLVKIDPKTGKCIQVGGSNTMLFVAVVDRYSGHIHERDDNFTDEQIALVHQHSRELEEVGYDAKL